MILFYTPKIFLLLSFIIVAEVFAQSTITLRPSVYYTRGNYSNEDNSNSIAGYLSGTWNNLDYVIFAYDKLKIKGNEWEYSQSNLIAGLIYNISNYYLKFNYLKIDGNYNENVNSYNYADSSNVVNIDFVKGDYPYYYGAGYTYFNQKGQSNIISHQANFRFEFIPHYKILLGIRATASFSTNESSMISLAGKINYQPFSILLIKTNLMLGKRMFFLDPDLLVIFNQALEQRLLAGIQLEYKLFQSLSLVGSFQHTRFETYNINYFIGGVKFNIDL